MSYALTSIDYRVENHEPIIYLFCRDEGLNRKVFKVKGMKPYYYYKDIFGEYPIQGIDGNYVTKKFCKLPSDVAVERERHHLTYESDILFPIRFLVDRGIRYGLNVENGEVVPADYEGNAVLPLFLDVEVEVTDTNIFPEPRIAKWMLLSCTIWCPIDGNIAMWRFEISNEEEEKEFLEFFIKIIQEFDPDVITAYNVFFDMCTIINRMKHHNIKAEGLSPLSYVRVDDKHDYVHIAGRNVFDFYAGFKKYMHRTLPSYELESIALDECDIPRSDYPLEYMNRNYIADVADYNLIDVYRMQALETKHEIIEFYDNIRIVVGCTFDETLEASKYVDVFLLRYAKDKFLLPRRPKGEKRQNYVGAVVLPPEKGVHKNVVFLDFTKMYPSILISYNISPETLRLAKPKEPHYTLPIGLRFKDEFGNDYVEWREAYYLKEPKGFLPNVATDLIQLRNSVQTDMLAQPRDSQKYKLLWHRQDALKVVLDAMYGVFAYPPFRLFIPEISASMTGQGRKLSLRTIDFVKGRFGVIAKYGDTDGLYFVLYFVKFPLLKELFSELDYCPELENLLSIEIGKWMRDIVNEFWAKEKDKFGLHMAPAVKLEYVFESLMLAKKKRYSAMEAKRSDSAYISQDIQKEIFNKIHIKLEPNDQILNYIKTEANTLKDKPLQYFGIPLPLKTNLKDMKNRARVKSIIYANQYLKQDINTGSHPLEYYVKTERLTGDEKKKYGFRDKPLLPWGLPTKFSFANWSPKAGNYVEKEYTANRIAFNKVPAESWRQFIDMNVMVEKTIYNKVETILQALGISEEDRIKLYGSKTPIKKEEEYDEEF